MFLVQRKSVLCTGIFVLIGLGMASCIREELPEKGVDVKSVIDITQVNNPNIAKATIQETSVTLYVKSMEKMKNVNLDFTVSNGATYSFVEVKMDSTFMDYNGQKLFVPGSCPIDTTVVGEIPTPTDFTKTQYIKVVSEAVGLNEDDHATQQVIDSQKSGFVGWEKDGKRYKEYVEGAHLYKIWSINALPAGIPTTLTFDNWYKPLGNDFMQPYEMVSDASGVQSQSNIWSSTNSSIALMAKTNPLVLYGAMPTTDVAPVREGENTNALLLVSNDIRYTNTVQRPFLAGCCFIGEYDGSDTGALTCTHIGLPFNQAPDKLCFWYKFLPMPIQNPQDNIFGYSFNVPGIDEYIGKQDKGFIRAVLYRTDDDTNWLNGETVRDESLDNIIAIAQFTPQGNVSEYTYQEVEFKYLKDYDKTELDNWQYNLAIYLASGYDGFRFITGANMNKQMTGQNLGEQMGTQLYIDEMEIKCK